MAVTPRALLLRQAAAYEAVASQGVTKVRSGCNPTQCVCRSVRDCMHPHVVEAATLCAQASAGVERLEGATAAAVVQAAAARNRDVALAAEAA
eukprot:scaffold43504_cov54-Phaeocystis_antarctica.AAC.1